jgi:ZIP family zinc transporter
MIGSYSWPSPGSAGDMVLYVFVVAVLTDLATGLGALPFVFLTNVTRKWAAILYALAGGMMISATVFSLLNEALKVMAQQSGSSWELAAGLLAGALFFSLTQKWVERTDWEIADLSAKDSKQALLILIMMFIHSIPEGVAIGVGHATGELTFGFILALAIAIHNIPEGMAVSLPLRAKGVSVGRCAWYAILTSVPQPIMAVPAFLLVSWFQPLLPAALGFAGGAMLFLVFVELVPDALRDASRLETAWGLLGGFIGMMLVTVYLSQWAGG